MTYYSCNSDTFYSLLNPYYFDSEDNIWCAGTQENGERKEKRRKARNALMEFLKRLEKEIDAIEEPQQWYEFTGELHSLLLKHGEAIEPESRQGLMEATKLAGESREGIRQAYQVLKREIEHYTKGLRGGIIFSSTFISAVAGGVIGVVVLIFFLYSSPDTTAPPVVNLLSPNNLDTVSDNTPTFDWSDVSDSSGVTYTIQISSGKDFLGTIISRPGRTDSTYTKQSPLTDGKYFWRVQAVDGAGNTGPFSEVYTFTLKIVPVADLVPPPSPILLSPSNRDTVSDNTPTFDWSDVSDSSGVTYTIQISSDKDFLGTIISRPGRTDSTYTQQSPLTDGKYFWRVQAVDGAGNTGPFSEVYTFTLTSIS
ncbi:MAG: hypothetical protein HMLIMOIP_001918 [Candidatus Nitrosomirales archaeon]